MFFFCVSLEDMATWRTYLVDQRSNKANIYWFLLHAKAKLNGRRLNTVVFAYLQAFYLIFSMQCLIPPSKLFVVGSEAPPLSKLKRFTVLRGNVTNNIPDSRELNQVQVRSISESKCSRYFENENPNCGLTHSHTFQSNSLKHNRTKQ